MNYQDMVAEARGLIQRDKQTRDRLIALTLAACEQVTQAEWAADIGAHYSTVRDWVRYARETKGLGAAAPNYDDWYRATRRDESDRGLSAVQAMPPERKAEIVRDLITDPEVADRALAQPEARSHARQAIERHDQGHRPLPLPPAPGDDQGKIRVLGHFLAIRERLIEIAQIVGRSETIHTDDSYRGAVLTSVEMDITRLEAIRQLAEGGESLDTALARMTADGDAA